MNRVWMARDDLVADALMSMKLEELSVLDALMLPVTLSSPDKSGIASAWNMKEQRLNKIGEVVDGPESRWCGS